MRSPGRALFAAPGPGNESEAAPPSRRARVPKPPPAPKLVYRVEGLGRKGIIRYVKVVGNPGAWQIIGLNGLFIEVRGKNVEEALRLAKRKIPFRPVVIRQVEGPKAEPEK